MRIQRGAKPALYAHSGRTSPLFVTRAPSLARRKIKGNTTSSYFQNQIYFFEELIWKSTACAPPSSRPNS